MKAPSPKKLRKANLIFEIQGKFVGLEVHNGEAKKILDARQRSMEHVFQAFPERF